MAGKRLMQTTSSRALKKPKTLTAEVAKLKRQVRSNIPELRQQSYTVTVPISNTAPIALLNPATIIGDEFKLHRIVVHDDGLDTGLGTATGAGHWGMLYSPNEGYTAQNALPDQTTPHGITNWLFLPDRTRCRVWDRQHKVLQTGGATLPANTISYYNLKIEKKFSIPMKIGTQVATQTNPDVVHNQIFYAGADVDNTLARTLYVTIWFTDS